MLRPFYAVAVAAVLFGCGSSPYTGDWTGKLKPTKEFLNRKRPSTEVKPSLDDSLHLSSDGTYTAKFSEVDYGGKWSEAGLKITLTPETYMGISKEQMAPKKGTTSTTTIDKIYAPMDLDVQSDGKSLTFTLPAGKVTLTKSAVTG